MSSTNRSTAREAHIADYYVTPVPSIVHFLKEAQGEIYHIMREGYVLDPCAGGDEHHEMSYPNALKEVFETKGEEKLDILTMDIREDSKADIKADFLTYKCSRTPSIIITNPPFNLAEEIIYKSLAEVKEGGLVIMLLRLNFFGSKRRQAFWKNNMPMNVYVHSQRMKFTNTGGTDSIEYMHCIWKKGFNPEFTKLKVI